MKPVAKAKRSFCSFAKQEKQDDGTIKVWGYASSEAEDADGDIIKASAMAAALPDYMKFGNIREMHQPSAAGVAIEAEVLDDGRTWLGAHIVDPIAVKKIETEVYKGFSIGGNATEYEPGTKNVITGLNLCEISLVDRPANPDAVFELWKAQGMQPNTTAAPETAATPAEQVDQLAGILNGGDMTIGEVLKAVHAALELKKAGGTGSPAEPASDAQLQTAKAAATDEEDDEETKKKKAADAAAAASGTADTATTPTGAVVDADKEKAAAAAAADALEKASALNASNNNGVEAQYPSVGSVVTLKNGDFTAQATVKDITDGNYTLETETQMVVVRAEQLLNSDASLSAPNFTVNLTEGTSLTFKAKEPGELQKASKGGELKKGFYQISDFACLLSSLRWILSDFQWEQELEDDTTSQTLPKLKQWMADGVEVLTTMVAEEAAEWKEGDAIELSLDSGFVQKAILPAMLKKGMAMPAGEREPTAAPLQKAAGVAALHEQPEFKEALEKAVGSHTAALTKTITDLNARLVKMEEQPVPAKGVLRAVTKSADGTDPEQVTPEVKPVTYQGAEDPVATALKKSLQNPGTLHMGGHVINK